MICADECFDRFSKTAIAQHENSSIALLLKDCFQRLKKNGRAISKFKRACGDHNFAPFPTKPTAQFKRRTFWTKSAQLDSPRKRKNPIHRERAEFSNALGTSLTIGDGRIGAAQSESRDLRQRHVCSGRQKHIRAPGHDEERM